RASERHSRFRLFAASCCTPQSESYRGRFPRVIATNWSVLYGKGQGPSELASVPMLSALLRAAFLVSVFRRLCWSRALLARREGGTKVEGLRGLGMAYRVPPWTGPTPISLYNPCKKSV